MFPMVILDQTEQQTEIRYFDARWQVIHVIRDDFIMLNNDWSNTGVFYLYS